MATGVGRPLCLAMVTTSHVYAILLLWSFGWVVHGAGDVGSAPVTHVVKNGYLLPAGDYVGVHTSELQARVIDSLYPQIHPKKALASISLVNSSVLRYLTLEGDYFADVPLVLPSLFVLRLNGTMKDAQNLSASSLNGVPHVGMITLNVSMYSAVVGGTVDATTWNATRMLAVSVLNSERSAVRFVRALSNWQTSIGVHGGSQNEIAHCDAGGVEGAPILARAIWLLATAKCYVHHCHVHHAQMHALDFDAYTASSVAWSNLCEDNKEEGIFVEETAHDNVITGNTCRRNKNGIGVYSKVVGPVKGNVFFGNLVQGNYKNAITAGGYGHSTNLHSDSNTFFANTALDTPPGLASFNPMHGANQHDYWFGNHVDGTGPDFFPIPVANGNVGIFES